MLGGLTTSSLLRHSELIPAAPLVPQPPSSEGTRSAVAHGLNGGEIKSGAILCAWAAQYLAVLPGKCFWVSLQMSNRGNEITGRNVFN